MKGNNSETGHLSAGDLVWAKIDGYPWWPSIILGVKEEDKKEPHLTKWTIAFLGEKESFQYLTPQYIKHWSEISTQKKKDKKLKVRESFMNAIAFGTFINSKELTYENHKDYIDYLQKKLISSGEQGVKQFKEHLDSGESLRSIKKKNEDQKQNNSMFNSELSAIGNEMEIIKKNLNTILTTLPPDQLLKHFSQVDFSNQEMLFESSTIDSKMALLNYLEFLCQLFQIPYEANQTLGGLIKKLNAKNE